MIFLAILVGAALASQSAVNSKLRDFVQSPLTASMVSFFIGAVGLTILTFASGFIFWEEWALLKGEPLWILTGGLLGVFSLTMNVILFPKLGGIQTAVLTIFGQVLMGTLLDQFGWLESTVSPMTLWKFVGLLLVIVGVVFATEVFFIKEVKASSGIHWKVLGVLAGTAGAAQASVNGQLGKVLDSPLLATHISFHAGLITLILVVIVTKSPVKTISLALKSGVKNYWIFIGGLLGIAYVSGAASLAPLLGTGQFIVYALFGQLVGSILIDRFGLLGAMKKEITRGKLLGVFIMLIGVMLIKFVN